MHICRISRTFPPNVDGTAYHVLGPSQTLSRDPQIDQTLIQPYPHGESYQSLRLRILAAGRDPDALVPEEDWDGLMQAIEYAATDQSWRSRTGSENRQLAQDRDWSRIAERVNAVYLAALDARKRRSGQPEKQCSSDGNSRVKP